MTDVAVQHVFGRNLTELGSAVWTHVIDEIVQKPSSTPITIWVADVVCGSHLSPTSATSFAEARRGRDGIGAALTGLGPQFPEEGPKKTLEAMTDWMISNVGD